MRLGRRRSAVEIRREQINRQLDKLQTRLAKIPSSDYTNVATYRRQLNRSRELISELEGELSMLACPGEYDELPAAVVADELGLTYKQVRNLIKLGEIAATGKAAHELICRGELERITIAGVPALLRRGEEGPAEIFEQAILHLQNGDLEVAKREYLRLEARQSWRGPHAPAFLVGLELATGEFDSALSSIKLMCEYEDPLWRVVAMIYVRRVLRGMEMKEKGAQEFRDHLIALADKIAATRSEKARRGSSNQIS